MERFDWENAALFGVTVGLCLLAGCTTPRGQAVLETFVLEIGSSDTNWDNDYGTRLMDADSMWIAGRINPFARPREPQIIYIEGRPR